uniref:Uncharacterized protein n=1 Tax=viral metagenome TaxID=1070528 RepID=A0A6C0IZE3_9ZZZZ
MTNLLPEGNFLVSSNPEEKLLKLQDSSEMERQISEVPFLSASSRD